MNSYIFVHGVKIYKFNPKDSEINASSLCLGNVSKDFSVDKIKKLDYMDMSMIFSVGYDNFDVDNILVIHKCFMKMHDMK